MSSATQAVGGRSLHVFELLRAVARWSARPSPRVALQSSTPQTASAAVPLETPEPAVHPTEGVASDPDEPQPAAAPTPRIRATVLPHRRHQAVATRVEPTPFDFEQARLDLLQSLALNRIGDHAVYDDRDILQRAILDDSVKARMFVDDLVQRITGEGEKTWDVVVSLGDYGAVFGTRLADALMEQYGHKEVAQRFLETFSLPGEEPEDARIDYRLRRGRGDTGHLLSGKRIVFAVPTITPQSWPEVFRQAQFLRSPQTNSESVRIVSIARIGHLRTDAPHGLKIDAIIDFR
jgi:hypothetical protein